MKKLIVLALSVLMLSALALTACSGEEAEQTVHEAASNPPQLSVPRFPETTPPPASTPTPPPYIPAEPEPEGPLSILTGLPIDEAYVNRRPIAVVVNNIRAAWPQTGLTYADIIYEVLTEGDVTRFVAIFHELPDQIGPVRSTRDYFTDFALNHDAIFVHHGGSPTGYSRLRDLRVANIDGMAHEGRVFWRDRSYPEWTGITGQRAMEHSSYTSRQRVLTHIESSNIRDSLRESENENFGFNFGEIPEGIEPAGYASLIRVPFSNANFRLFIFDPETGRYYVENRGGAQLDAITREQLAVQNVLIQFTVKRVIPGCGMGYREVTTVGSGRGYLATGGRYYAVRWEKSSHTSPTRWYFECGTPIVMTPGKTWVNVFQSTGSVTME